MNFWTAAVAIMAILGIVEITKHWIKSRKDNQNKAFESADKHRMEDLENRIRALETIVTDRREQLKRQIDDI